MNRALRCGVICLLLLSVPVSCARKEGQKAPLPSPFRDVILSADNAKRLIHVTLSDSLCKPGDFRACTSDTLNQEKVIAVNQTDFTWPLQGHPQERILNTLKIYRTKGPPVEIVIAKETDSYLRHQFNFSREHGYLVLERATLERTRHTSRRDNATRLPRMSQWEQGQLLDDFRSFSESDPLRQGEIREDLRKAVQVTRYIWSHFRRTGPSPVITKNMSAWGVLQAVDKEGATLQCAGTRDLFLAVHHLLLPDVPARQVDVYRYFPFIENITPNSHAVVELYIDNRWIMLDPFLRVYFTDQTGRILSSDDIITMIRHNRTRDMGVNLIDVSGRPRTELEPKELLYDPFAYNYFSCFHYQVSRDVLFE